MKPQIFILLLVTLASLATAEVCPREPKCQCKWVAGKRTVDCKGSGLSSIPTRLKQDTQILVMDGLDLGRLEKDAFSRVGLVNLQEISLRGCHLLEVHENAFRGLLILKDVDLSANNLTKLQPKTFDGNDGLQSLKMAQNPLQELTSYQFPPLKALKRLDFSQCQLQKLDKKAFQNLGPSLEHIALNDNLLRTVSVDTFVPIAERLKTLDLHGNPWLCDCKLQSFREFVIHKKLYNRPTSCMDPARLHEKMWDDLQAKDFACKPEITIPFEFVFSSPGRNATLSCHITGSPPPQTRWVINGRIVNNNTTPVGPFSEQRMFLFEETYSYQKWFNLTITNAMYDNLGEYKCVAENTGGVMEKSVHLTFDSPDSFNNSWFDMRPEDWTIMIGAITASLVFIALIVAICCCLCFCRKAKKKDKITNGNSSKAAISAFDQDQSLSQRLLPPTPNPQGVPMTPNCAHLNDTEMTDIRTPSVISKPISSDSSSRSFEVDPDLIHHFKKTSTPLSVSTLMSNGSHHRVSPSQFHTLHYHGGHGGHGGHHHPRSVSCDHSSQTLHRLTPQPQKIVQQQQQARPGYVTLPRRPRSSWSAPPTRDSPLYSSMTMSRRREGPVYDGVGPRTSADGSSMGTLPRSKSSKSPIEPTAPRPKHSLGPYYAPIAECQEPLHEAKRQNSNHSAVSGDLEESISSYCEPFGKMMAPGPVLQVPPPPAAPSNETTPTPLSSSKSTTSAESELEALIQVNGHNGAVNGVNGTKHEVPPMMPLLPPIMTSTVGVAETAFNEEQTVTKKVGPKTLPKPKVRPVPPPKPGKSALINRPVTFQDEGVDGSEV